MQARLQEIKKKIKWWFDRSTNLKVTFETDKIDDAYTDIKFLLDALEQAQDRERVLRDVLEFYANKNNYEDVYSDTESGCELDSEAPVLNDYGNIAREALKEDK